MCQCSLPSLLTSSSTYFSYPLQICSRQLSMPMRRGCTLVTLRSSCFWWADSKLRNDFQYMWFMYPWYARFYYSSLLSWGNRSRYIYYFWARVVYFDVPVFYRYYSYFLLRSRKNCCFLFDRLDFRVRQASNSLLCLFCSTSNSYHSLIITLIFSQLKSLMKQSCFLVWAYRTEKTFFKCPNMADSFLSNSVSYYILSKSLFSATVMYFSRSLPKSFCKIPKCLFMDRKSLFSLPRVSSTLLQIFITSFPYFEEFLTKSWILCEIYTEIMPSKFSNACTVLGRGFSLFLDLKFQNPLQSVSVKNIWAYLLWSKWSKWTRLFKNCIIYFARLATATLSSFQNQGLGSRGGTYEPGYQVSSLLRSQSKSQLFLIMGALEKLETSVSYINCFPPMMPNKQPPAFLTQTPLQFISGYTLKLKNRWDFLHCTLSTVSQSQRSSRSQNTFSFLGSLLPITRSATFLEALFTINASCPLNFDCFIYSRFSYCSRLSLKSCTTFLSSGRVHTSKLIFQPAFLNRYLLPWPPP